MNNKNWKIHNTDSDGESVDMPKIISVIEKSPTDNSLQGNKIYFYSEITQDSILNLNKQIDELSKQMKIIQFVYNLFTPPVIEIHICSEGGEIFSALSSVDKISNNIVPIHTFIEGTALSAATLLSVSGHKRFITQNSCTLLHQISGNFWGSFQQLKDEHSNFELIMKILKNIYLKKTKFKSKQLDELLKRDLYLDSELCLKFGIVDEII